MDSTNKNQTEKQLANDQPEVTLHQALFEPLENLTGEQQRKAMEMLRSAHKAKEDARASSKE